MLQKKERMAHMEQFAEIAARIRELRDACGFTQEELAKEIGIDVSVLRGYEEDGYNIPISVIYKIATLCGVDFTEILTGNDPRLDTYQVVKKGQGLSVERVPGYDFEDLAYRFSHKIIQPLRVRLQPDDAQPALITHTGQEFNLVLEGKVKVLFNDKELILEEGDSIYFNPLYPHGQVCADDKPAVFLTVIAE